MRFLTRKRGTVRQRGLKFPVLEKKKLPKRISIKKTTKRPSPITNVSFTPPEPNKPGRVSFDFDGQRISNEVVLVSKNSIVGQFDLIVPRVYISDDLPSKYWLFLSQHEAIERYLKLKYGMDENREAHVLADHYEFEHFKKHFNNPKKAWRGKLTGLRLCN